MASTGILWRDRVLAVAGKTIRACELPRGRSNQHEFNVPRSVLTFLRENAGQRLAADVTLFPAGDAKVFTLRYVDVLLYDARMFVPERSEFRLYYSRAIDEMLESIQPGDLAIFALNVDERFQIMLVSALSPFFDSLSSVRDFHREGLWATQMDPTVAEYLDLSGSFRIVDTSALERAYDESLGSKTKGWFYPPDNPDFEILEKENRPNTIEAQVEKICMELARMVSLPHAGIELAGKGNQIEGVISPSFGRPRPLFRLTDDRRPKRKSAEERTIEVIMGNRVLQSLFPEYDIQKKRGHAQHTLDNIVKALEKQIVDQARALRILEYFLFDCWIGNTDRHHENWAVLRVREGKHSYSRLAPLFDHGAALAAAQTTNGRNRQIDKVAKFYKAGRSAIFDPQGDSLTFEALAQACFQMEKQRTGGIQQCAAFVDKITGIDPEEISSCLNRFPPCTLTESDATFIRTYLVHSARVLRGIQTAFRNLEGRPASR